MPVGRLTTHVLDTRLGQPARGMTYELFHILDDAQHLLCEGLTNDDGRAPEALLEGEAFQPGIYELVFYAGDYQAGLPDTIAGFYDVIPIRFLITDSARHYHVPLLLSPFGYSTYRGS
jgi:5-hydroxyisourate hydrolase